MIDISSVDKPNAARISGRCLGSIERPAGTRRIFLKLIEDRPLVADHEVSGLTPYINGGTLEVHLAAGQVVPPKDQPLEAVIQYVADPAREAVGQFMMVGFEV